MWNYFALPCFFPFPVCAVLCKYLIIITLPKRNKVSAKHSPITAKWVISTINKENRKVKQKALKHYVQNILQSTSSSYSMFVGNNWSHSGWLDLSSASTVITYVFFSKNKLILQGIKRWCQYMFTIQCKL